MAIETFGFIDDLNAANPTATDNVSEGDDHIRGVKATLKNTFPNITGAINATDEELNVVDMSASGSTSGQVLTSNGTSTVATWQDAVANFASLTDTTVSSSDPTATTNPEAVGHLWANTTSGEIFVCTSATTNDNIWINVGGGVGGVAGALTSPTLNSPADSDQGANVTYTITSTDADDDKFVFDVQSSNFTFGSVSAGTGTVVGNTIEITGFGGSTVNLTLSYTSAGTFNNRVKAVDSTGIHADSAWSSTDSIIISVPPARAGDRAVIAVTSSSTNLDYVSISTGSNSSSFGNLSFTGYVRPATSGEGKGLFNSGAGVIEYINFSSTGNSAPFGYLLRYSTHGSGEDALMTVSNGVRAVWAGGPDPTSSSRIQYLTFASAGTATTFGALTSGGDNGAGVSDGSRGVFMGGYSNRTSGVIDYITIATTGNAASFGFLNSYTGESSGMSSDVRGVTPISANSRREMDYITIATTGNANNFGALIQGREATGCTSDLTTGLITGGGGNSPYLDTMESITIATAANATSFGSLTSTAYAATATSGD